MPTTDSGPGVFAYLKFDDDLDVVLQELVGGQLPRPLRELRIGILVMNATFGQCKRDQEIVSTIVLEHWGYQTRLRIWTS